MKSSVVPSPPHKKEEEEEKAFMLPFSFQELSSFLLVFVVVVVVFVNSINFAIFDARAFSFKRFFFILFLLTCIPFALKNLFPGLWLLYYPRQNVSHLLLGCHSDMIEWRSSTTFKLKMSVQFNFSLRHSWKERANIYVSIFSKEFALYFRLSFLCFEFFTTVDRSDITVLVDWATYPAEMPTSADSNNNCVANGCPVTHQTLRQQGGTGQDSHIHLADWTLSVAAVEKRKRTGRKLPSYLLTNNGKARMNISHGPSENHHVTYIGQARLKIIIYRLDQVKITKLLTYLQRSGPAEHIYNLDQVKITKLLTYSQWSGPVEHIYSLDQVKITKLLTHNGQARLKIIIYRLDQVKITKLVTYLH